MKTPKTRPTFEQAKAQYVHRYTMEHVPAWAKKRPVDNGGTEYRYYAPQYSTDLEWYENTLFPGEPALIGDDGKYCQSSNQTWPLGQFLDKPYTKR